MVLIVLILCKIQQIYSIFLMFSCKIDGKTSSFSSLLYHANDVTIGSDHLKPSTDRMLTRIKSVYMFISERGTVTTQELVDEFGITPRTIQRDLNVLAYNDLIHSPSKGKWTTTKKRVKMSS